MPISLVLLIYNILLPVLVLLAFPAWVVKMWKRGGYGTGLMQRLAVYKTKANTEPKGVVYIHAVSVGEVLIALKLIDQWRELHPEEKFVLAATTATGHEVARQKATDHLRVIYSPVDFGWMVRAVFRRFTPQQIILVEAEVWPNFMRIAQKKGISVSVINARLSKRSEARLQKFGALIKPVYSMIDRVCTQNSEDSVRFAKLGIAEEKIHTLGSIKFDSDGGAQPKRREEFQELLNNFEVGRKMVLAVSTHTGEEKMMGEAFLQSEMMNSALLVIVPRHAERRAEVILDMKSLGFEPILKTEFHLPESSERACLIVDTTGELRDWTAHADVAVIGKSFLGEGGQNPVEAISANVPVLCGEHMGNFEPLISQLREEGGVLFASTVSELASKMKLLLSDEGKAGELTKKAQKVITQHEGAVVRTIELLYLNASQIHSNIGNNIKYE